MSKLVTLRRLHFSETYLTPTQTWMMEHFEEIMTFCGKVFLQQTPSYMFWRAPKLFKICRSLIVGTIDNRIFFKKIGDSQAPYLNDVLSNYLWRNFQQNIYLFRVILRCFLLPESSRIKSIVLLSFKFQFWSSNNCYE